jgi:hypothetical protein
MVLGVQQIEPLWTTLGSDRAKALQGLHAFSRADNNGQFTRKGKPVWFKLFLDAEDYLIEDLCTLCGDADMSEKLQLTLTQFVFTAYRQKGVQLSSIPELRWHLFCKYMAESGKLLSTLGALKQHILRTHIKARVLRQTAVSKQELFDPLENGYHRDNNDGQLQPTTRGPTNT